MLAVEVECSMLAGKVAAAEETFTLAEASALELGAMVRETQARPVGAFLRRMYKDRRRAA